MKLLISTLIPVIAIDLLFLSPCAAGADGVQRSTTLKVEGAYYPDDNKGYGVGDGGFAPISYDPVENPGFSLPPDEGRDLGSGWGAAELQFLLTHRIVLPFRAFSGPLTSDNSIAFDFTGALTPVSIRLEAQTTLTPIAFLNVFAGAMIGTGWDIGPLHGMGLNTDGSGVPESASFQGVVLKSWVGGTFQFDLAVLLPGDWTHVVVTAGPKLQYACFSGADKREAWVWEDDGGENFNGFRFYGTYFLGYRMPLVLNTVGLLLETGQNLGYMKDLDSEDSQQWGSDYVRITVGPVFNFTLAESSSLAVLIQLRRERLYDESSIFAKYFRNRNAVGTYWDFYRIVFSYSRKLQTSAN